MKSRKSTARLLREAFKRGYRAARRKMLRESNTNIPELKTFRRFKVIAHRNSYDLEGIGDEELESIYDWMCRCNQVHDRKDVYNLLRNIRTYDDSPSEILDMISDLGDKELYKRAEEIFDPDYGMRDDADDSALETLFDDIENKFYKQGAYCIHSSYNGYWYVIGA